VRVYYSKITVCLAINLI